MELKKQVTFRPAFDKRDSDGGIGCVTCCMTLCGDDGCIEFVFFTGMYLPSCVKEIDAIHIQTVRPNGYYVRYHSKKPIYKDQESVGFCPLIKCDCYSDANYLQADKFLKVLIEQGSNPVWDLLTEYYNEKFNKSEAKNE